MAYIYHSISQGNKIELHWSKKNTCRLIINLLQQGDFCICRSVNTGNGLTTKKINDYCQTGPKAATT